MSLTSFGLYLPKFGCFFFFSLVVLKVCKIVHNEITMVETRKENIWEVWCANALNSPSPLQEFQVLLQMLGQAKYLRVIKVLWLLQRHVR